MMKMMSKILHKTNLVCTRYVKKNIVTNEKKHIYIYIYIYINNVGQFELRIINDNQIFFSYVFIRFSYYV
jgi:hypothetical protein